MCTPKTDAVDEKTALLHHMIHHNKHHTNEIRELAASVDSAEIKETLNEAVHLFDEGNALLEKALAMMKEN